jgi:microcystin-dependent protein
MADPFLGELRIVAFNFAPQGWALCNGQLLPIQQYTALFSLLGTYFGGNGQNTFALPNLQGRVPYHLGTNAFGSNFTQGQTGGEENHTLQLNEMPQHNHLGEGSAGATDVASPANAFWASGISAYNTSPDSPMLSTAVANNGGGQPHPNWPPYLVVNVIIALAGIFPSRN